MALDIDTTCWDVLVARNKGMREGYGDGVSGRHGKLLHADGSADQAANYYAPPLDEAQHKTDGHWTVTEALKALRLAVEKADRAGGALKYCDLVTPENPQGLCAWYRQATRILDLTGMSYGSSPGAQRVSPGA